MTPAVLDRRREDVPDDVARVLDQLPRREETARLRRALLVRWHGALLRRERWPSFADDAAPGGHRDRWQLHRATCPPPRAAALSEHPVGARTALRAVLLGDPGHALTALRGTLENAGHHLPDPGDVTLCGGCLS